VADNSISAADELRAWVLQPAPRPSDAGSEQVSPDESYEPMPRLRVIGPGRFERGYLHRLSGLAAELEGARECESRARERLRQTTAALEVSRSVERGCQRRLDRSETWLEERTQALLASERQQKRLALTLGAMQRENEMLRAQLQLAPARSGRLERGSPAQEPAQQARSRPGFLRRVFGGLR
jgi:hypothetical protein